MSTAAAPAPPWAHMARVPSAAPQALGQPPLAGSPLRSAGSISSQVSAHLSHIIRCTALQVLGQPPLVSPLWCLACRVPGARGSGSNQGGGVGGLAVWGGQRQLGRGGHTPRQPLRPPAAAARLPEAAAAAAAGIIPCPRSASSSRCGGGRGWHLSARQARASLRRLSGRGAPFQARQQWWSWSQALGAAVQHPGRIVPGRCPAGDAWWAKCGRGRRRGRRRCCWGPWRRPALG